MKHSTVSRCSDMDPIELVIAMKRAGVTQQAIADALNVSRTAVHLVVYNKATSHRIRKAIAEALCIDLKKIWPSTYLYNCEAKKSGRPSAQYHNY